MGRFDRNGCIMMKNSRSNKGSFDCRVRPKVEDITRKKKKGPCKESSVSHEPNPRNVLHKGPYGM
jgi:hypothetical protein